jgi:hypothetical protein
MGQGVVLRAHGQGGHEALQRPQRLQRAGEEAGVGRLHLGKARLALPPHEIGGRDQHRVLVEGTGGDDVAGHRIDRVVLEDRQQSAGLEQPPQRGQQVHVLGGVDMVEHAGREDQVEALRGQGRLSAVVAHQLRRVREPAGGDRQALLRDVEADQPGIRECAPEAGQGAADPGPEIQHRGRIGPSHPRPAPAQGLDLVAGEVVGLLAGEANVAGVGGEVFVGELVELGQVHHRGSTSAGLDATTSSIR